MRQKRKFKRGDRRLTQRGHTVIGTGLTLVLLLTIIVSSAATEGGSPEKTIRPLEYVAIYALLLCIVVFFYTDRLFQENIFGKVLPYWYLYPLTIIFSPLVFLVILVVKAYRGFINSYTEVVE
jgi:hypothetical protein